jgi:hypothetical protein
MDAHLDQLGTKETWDAQSRLYLNMNMQVLYGISLKEKGQYVTNTFTTTCDYFVFATKFLPFAISVTLC